MTSRTLKARVIVTLKAGILDPQGKAIEGALKSLEIGGIDSVRQGKIFEMDVVAETDAAAETMLKGACEKLLANLIVEDYRIEILG